MYNFPKKSFHAPYHLYINIIVARAWEKRKTTKQITRWFLFFSLKRKFWLNDNHCTSYNFPNIFCSFCPWTNTWCPRNRVPSPHHSQDKPLYPCTLSPILQTFFRTSCIYTVKKASSLSSSWFSLLYIFSPKFASIFPLYGEKFHSAYKTPFPCKKLSNNPLTSMPVFSKLATMSPTDATLKVCSA